MEQKYDVASLIETFKNHAKMSEDHHEQVKVAFVQNYPDEPLPQNISNPFNVSEALASMCEEIYDLKADLRDHRRYEHP